MVISVARTTTVTRKASVETAAEKRAPKKPEPMARRKAMNERAQAMGWRTIMCEKVRTEVPWAEV